MPVSNQPGREGPTIRSQTVSINVPRSTSLALNNWSYMATYVYETIPKDGKTRPRRFEVQQKMSDPPLKLDPESGLPVRRITIGGSGWVTPGATIFSMHVRRSRGGPAAG